MMTHTDRHFRYFLRLLSRHIMLYTEMITTGAIIHGKQYHRLEFSKEEHPLAIQLGGSNPKDLSECAKIAEQSGFDEINLNIGCPSDRVKNGKFGACLMAHPQLVADCVSAMNATVKIPVSVKTRTGIDELDSYEYLSKFIETVSSGGCNTFILHARKAWLQGLSPRQNREIPPLNYNTVYKLKIDFQQLEIVINGGITSLESGLEHLQHVDGIMIGRAVCNNPYLLANADNILYKDEYKNIARTDILKKYIEYVEKQLIKGASLHEMTRHILGLFQGQPGARRWRRYLSENIYKNNSSIKTIEDALSSLQAA
ncbi:MAG: tRNA-dihydrouridine synthase A [Gammaproteobacteria bacterium]|jgi:tRNA-dihydrouridine synthase A